MINFASSMTEKLRAAEKAQTEEVRRQNAEKTRKFSLQTIVTWLLAFLAGEIKENVRVEMSTDKVNSIINLGGLPEFTEVLKKFFSEAPGMYFIYNIPTLLEKLSSFPELQLHVWNVYVNRALNHGGEGEDFQFAIKGAMCAYYGTGAGVEDYKVLATNLIANHSKALAHPANANMSRMLDSISKSGRYYMPQNIPTPAQGAKEKGDDDQQRGNHGNKKWSNGNGPTVKYVDPKDVDKPATAPSTPAEPVKKVGLLGEALQAAKVVEKAPRKLTRKVKIARAAAERERQLLNGADQSASQTASA